MQELLNSDLPAQANILFLHFCIYKQAFITPGFDDGAQGYHILRLLIILLGCTPHSGPQCVHRPFQDSAYVYMFTWIQFMGCYLSCFCTTQRCCVWLHAAGIDAAAAPFQHPPTCPPPHLAPSILCCSSTAVTLARSPSKTCTASCSWCAQTSPSE